MTAPEYRPVRGELNGTVHALVINPWWRIWSPLCRRAQVVPGLTLTDDPVSCERCLIALGSGPEVRADVDGMRDDLRARR